MSKGGLLKNKNINLIGIFMLWILTITYLVLHHALWRDEVRNFMIGIGATSRIHIIGNPHPFLVYKIEQLLYWITDSYYVLPASSLFISLFSVILLLFFSPFNFRLKALILFGYPMLYEYTVMDRNYGISALLMLLLACCFSTDKYKYIFSGPILFLLANTNVHSALIVGGFSVLWPLSIWYENGKKWSEDNKKACLNSFLGIAGFIACFMTVYPTRYDLAAAHPVEMTVKHHFRFFKHLTFFGCKDYLSDVFGHHLFGKIVYLALEAVAYAAILFSPLVLWGDAFLFSVALLSLIGFSAFFSIVYQGNYRHEALWLMLVVALLWIKKNTYKEPAGNVLNKIGSVSFYTILTIQVILSGLLAFHEVHKPNSMSKQFVDFINKDEILKNSPILSSMDYNLEAIPYYTKRPVFMMTLNDYDVVVPYKNKLDYNLDDLLKAAQKLAVCSKSPPLILIANDKEKVGSSVLNIMDENAEKSVRNYMYNYWTFTVTSEQKKRFLENTREIARYPNGYLEQGFIVYQLNVARTEQNDCRSK